MCFVCRDKTLNCPYCDGEGQNYIEASDKTIARWINNLSEERKSGIINYMDEGIECEKK